MKSKVRIAALLALALVLAAASALAACPGEHRYGAWRTDRSATCTRQGHQMKYCRDCDHWEQRYIPKLPHELIDVTILEAPTCMENGKEEGTCTACGGLIRRSIDKLGHDWGEVKTITAPTCTKLGKGERDCLRCEATKDEKLEKIPHEYGEWTVTKAPQGRKKGVRVAACLSCGREITERFYPEGTLYEEMTPCEEVVRLQTMLCDLGYYKGSIRSGAFGQLTTRAVERFQQEHDIEQTGLADPATIAAIEAAWAQATGGAIALSEAERSSAEPAKAIEE